MRLVVFLLFLFLSCTSLSSSVSVHIEKSILLQFKSLLSDLDGVLSSWNNETNHCSSWFGVSCNSESKVFSLKIHGGYAGNDYDGLDCFRSLEFPYRRFGIRRRCLTGGGRLRGKLSPLIGKLTDLRVLSMPFNDLSGEIPLEIWDLENLEVVDLEGNLLSGRFGFGFFDGLKKLRVLNLGFNFFDGEIPVAVAKYVGLEVLNLAGNRLKGQIPGFFGGLLKLRGLYLGHNELEGSIPEDFGSDCGGLQHLDLSGNKLVGRIPRSLGSCRRLKTLLLYSNMLTGDIPAEIGQLRRLKVLDVSKNFISGGIPAELGRCKDLLVLVLSNVFETWTKVRKISGKSSLTLSNDEHNQFHGSIPSELTTLPNLRILWAPRASLHGTLPSYWGQCMTLEMVNLARNDLVGSVHGVFGRCKKLRYLDLSLSKLGEKPYQKLPVSCRGSISLSSDSVQSYGPSSTYKAYFMLQTCLASHLPSSIINVSSFDMSMRLSLRSHKTNSSDVSRSYLHGLWRRSMLSASSPARKLADGNRNQISNATSYQRDNGLNSVEIASIVSAAAVVTVLLLLAALYFYTRKWVPNAKVRVSEPKPITVFNDIGVPMLYENIVEATGNFNASNCIGSGGFGATYKAEIFPGTLVAVKRLAAGRFQGAQQFHAEIKALGMIKHPNLVTLIGYHASEKEMFLIYNFLSGGNLEKFIMERSQTAISWKILHKIALDIARALYYLHDQCDPRVLHRDVKPSNILLDNDFNAYLSDFGLARLLGNSETHATTGVAGTFGYVAPEYAMTCRVSEKADVYSYGVVLLELISDKRALDPSFSAHENGFNIVSWACMLLSSGQAKEVFTAELWKSGPHDDLVEVLHLAVKCTVETLSIRPTMKQVVHRLKQLQPR